ncbi:MAG: dTMP kinase [Clostridiales bacterium]|nr:dTMP kinase [Clostridiales bacterium]
MERGLFVTFEGIDGCGKTTQIEMLSSDLEKENIPFVLIREPGGTDIGEKIRTILLDKANSRMHARTELLLYEAARAQIVEERIKPELSYGKVVICDRFFDSTVAYQGIARDLGLQAVDYLNHWSTAGLAPDITFLLDLDEETAYRRRHGRSDEEDRLEAEGLAFMKKVREGYLLSSRDQPRIRVISATDTPEVIYEKIKKTIWEELEK